MLVYLVRQFISIQFLSRLPVSEPVIFSGDVLKYLSWKIALNVLIVESHVPDVERLSWLKKSLRDPDLRKSVSPGFNTCLC